MKRLIILVYVIIVIVLIGMTTFFVARHLAYDRVEKLTQLHAHEFTAVVQEIGADSCEKSGYVEEPIEYYKVFRYTSESAKLFVVLRFEDGNRHGLYVYLERELGEWRITQFELVWARYGSADEWTWPPYW